MYLGNRAPGMSVFRQGLAWLNRMVGSGLFERRSGDADHPSLQGVRYRVPRPSRLVRIARIVGATIVVLLLALTMSGAGLYFLMRGEAVENSTLTRRIEASVQKLVGPQFAVDLGQTTIGFDPDGLLSVAANDVAIRRPTDNQLISRLGRVVVGVRPLSIVRGDPQVDAVIVENSTLDVRLIAFGAAPAKSRTVEEFLALLHDRLEAAREDFNDSHFRLFQLRNILVTGLGVGRIDPGEVLLHELDLRYRRKSTLTLSASLTSQRSNLSLNASYQPDDAGGQSLKIGMEGLSMREWAHDPSPEGTGFLGSDAMISLAGSIPFGADGAPGEPKFTVSTEASSLRFGDQSFTSIDSIALNLRLMPDRNQIEIDPSPAVGGPFRTTLRGGVTPTEGGDWLSGPLKFELIAEPTIRKPTVEGESSIVLAGSATGVFRRSERLMEVSSFRMLAGDDEISGSAAFTFNGITPAVVAQASSAGLDVAAVKQAWPFFLSPPARKWVYSHVKGGRLRDIRMRADLPPGVIGRFRMGARMEPGEFELSTGFSGVEIETFGELPAIRQAGGSFSIKGMEVLAELNAGAVKAKDGGEASVERGSYRIEDFGIRPNLAELRVSAAGPVRTLASIIESKPLSVLTRLKLRAKSASGSGDVDLVARFQVRPGLTYQDVEWNAIADLKQASSTDKIFGRTIQAADVIIEATPDLARITGKAEIDGTPTQLSLIEPIGKSDVEREHRISARLDEAARKKMGFSLEPIVSGPVNIDLLQQDNGPQRQTVDLADAELKLPWIGWTKGKGIPATATFSLNSAKGVTKLDDFYIEGPGFSAAGRLVIDKGGLALADFANISLNEGDSFSLKLERKKKDYSVSVAGLRYDARSLVNQLFHERSTADAGKEGGASISVSASLGEVRGFGGRVLRNVEMTYGSRAGKFDNLSLRGAFGDNAYISVFAATASGRTDFEIRSADAGSALAFIDIYRQMRGGDLVARLSRTGNGPFTGNVVATNFVIENEPRLARLVSEPAEMPERGQSTADISALRRVDTNRVRFREARTEIEKGEGYLRVANGIFNSSQMGFTFDGMVYDKSNRMDLTGTFLPAIGLSRAIGAIPLVGELLGNGRDSGLLGVTFRLRGPARSPNIEINPMSLVAPGVFRKVFEFRQ